MMNAAFIVVALFAGIWGTNAQGPIDLLCAQVTCPAGETCGALAKCEEGGCSFEAVCLPQGEWSHGCSWDLALVELNSGTPLNVNNQPASPYELFWCGSRRQCPGGYFCSGRMMDTSSRCCQSRAGSSSRPGNCPAITSFQDSVYFCVDQCLNDDDCNGDEKCCVTSEECPRKECKPPA